MRKRKIDNVLSLLVMITLAKGKERTLVNFELCHERCIRSFSNNNGNRNKNVKKKKTKKTTLHMHYTFLVCFFAVTA